MRRGKQSVQPAWRLVFRVLAALFCSAAVASAANLNPRWRWSNPAPHGGNVYGMAYGLGLTVQVAERGQLYTSEDLRYWEPHDTHTTNTLLSVAFLGNRLIAAGENGTVVYADSLDNFQVISLGTSDWLLGAAASTNEAVLVGDNAAIYYSADGTNWARQTPPKSVTAWLRGVAYGNNQFVAVGENGTILSSANGKSWKTEKSATTQHLNGVSFANDHFWITGEQGAVMVDSASSWVLTTVGTTNNLYAAAGITNQLVLAGERALRFQETNGPWLDELDLTKPAPAPGWTYYAALGEATLHFAAGRSGMMVEGVKTNSHGAAWIEWHNSVRNWLWEVAALPGLYVAAGDRATIMTSSDGVHWDLELVPDAATNAVLLGVGGDTNLVLAAGNRGTILASPFALTNVVTTNYVNSQAITVTNLVSTLGSVWRAAVPPTTNDLQGVAANKGRYVVTGGNGTVLLSSNGLDWSLSGMPATAFLSGAAGFQNGFVAVGDRGTILTSADGTTWTAQNSGTTNWLFRVRNLNGQLFAVGQNGVLLASGDGVNWVPRATGTTKWLNDIALVSDTYYAIGNQGTVLASSNAVDWVSIGAITQKSLFGAAGRGGQLIVAGLEGLILRAPVLPVTNQPSILRFGLSSPTNGQVQKLMLIYGHADQRLNVQSSTNLLNWDAGPIVEVLTDDGTLLYLESSASQAREFFRLQSLP